MSAEQRRRAEPDEIERWLRERIAENLHVTTETVQPEASFESFGIDSARAINLVVELSEWLDLENELQLELLFEAQSIRQAAEEISQATRETASGSNRLGDHG